VAGSYKYANETSGFIESREFLDNLIDYTANLSSKTVLHGVN
jgi:hypothetical protein